jgi:nucleoid DNA-binding protein
MKEYEFKREDAVKFVDNFFEVMIKSLEMGEEVRVPGFGNFVLRTKSARVGRNPKTGEEHAIPARTVVSFRTSGILKEAIKSDNNKVNGNN